MSTTHPNISRIEDIVLFEVQSTRYVVYSSICVQNARGSSKAWKNASSAKGGYTAPFSSFKAKPQENGAQAEWLGLKYREAINPIPAGNIAEVVKGYPIPSSA